MGMNVEQFRGIQFVRISSMSKAQQEQVWDSFDQEKIIKIIKDEALMNDCILYSDYAAWQSGLPKPSVVSEPSKPAFPAVVGKLAFE